LVTWTLSAPGCPEYDMASLSITILAPLQANLDGVVSVSQNEQVSVAVLQNDLFDAPLDIRILQNPSQGTATFDSQNWLDYQANENAQGPDTLMYEICYTDCDASCDTALVLFMNLRNEDPCVITGDTSNVFTNGLTPNGDGENDKLIFKIVSIEDCAVNYAKSEIIIYNRWGDIVFEASPYKNDWDGSNKDGKELPPGVYYFVLRITLNKVYTQFGSVILIR
jgi:large repetitive protein